MMTHSVSCMLIKKGANVVGRMEQEDHVLQDLSSPGVWLMVLAHAWQTIFFLSFCVCVYVELSFAVSQD